MPYTTLISTAALADLLDRTTGRAKEQLTLVDCRFSLADTERGRRDYVESHIPGAVYAHLDEDLSSPMQAGVTGRHPLPDPAVLAQTLGGWGIGPRLQVVCYDDFGGGIAARLWWLLRWLGHESVAVLNGGWPAWVSEGRATVSGRENREAVEFRPHPRPQLTIPASGVEAMLQRPTRILIDARAADRFRGENETIDPVAGHIHGAVNAPWQDNVDASGKFLPPEVLRARFQAILAETDVNKAAVYCGSGVTACHNLLAMVYAGLPQPRLYAGSWSEWITEGNRPISGAG